MHSTSDRDGNGQSPPAATPAFEQVLTALQGCSRDEKKILLDRILRDLIGDHPDREYSLWNPDESSYLFLVPPSIHARLSLTPEVLAELDRRSKNPGKLTPFRETIDRLEAMGKASQEG